MFTSFTSTSIPGGSLVDPLGTVSTLFVATKAMVCRRKATGNVAPVELKDQSPKDVDLAEMVHGW